MGEVTEAKDCLDLFFCAGNDGSVKSEKEAAQRGYEGHPKHVRFKSGFHS